MKSARIERATYIYFGGDIALPELHADLFSRHACPLEFILRFEAVDERGEDYICPTTFVVDATDNSK